MTPRSRAKQSSTGSTQTKPLTPKTAPRRRKPRPPVDASIAETEAVAIGPAAEPAGAPVQLDVHPKPWEAKLNEPKVAVGFRLPTSLRDRQDGLHDWIRSHDEAHIPEWLRPVNGMNDIACYALQQFLERAENEVNGGRALAPLLRRR